ncbi:MAG TPA: FTR1 family protein [Chloroflexia bacterium]|nr:FTR1 family protein [Chloroflexia bacterium]
MRNSLQNWTLARPSQFRISLALLAMLVSLSLWFSQASFARAASAEDDLARINANIETAISAAQAGDTAGAQKAYKAFDDAWFNIEDGVRAKSKDTYRAIELKMQDVEFAFSKNPPASKEVVTALEALETTNEAFIKGQAVSSTSTPATSVTTTEKASVATLLNLLSEARADLNKQDFAGAQREVNEFQQTWLDVEGQIKTRSADAYTQTENDAALLNTLLSQKSPEAGAVLDRMSNRLAPYTEANSYGVFDAMIILLREGLEALLVVVALLTFLKKSGNADKQRWIWGGALTGIGVSVLLGIAIQLLFSSAINGSNREMIEGFTGLVAAVMLLYVSYWMHSKASAGAWQRYIRQKSTAALATGSLFGLATLAFLAIFREGAETVLFFLGIGSSISTGDLLLGLGIGAIILAVIGVLLVVVGLRIPMGPFFTVASILVFYLCFKFVGMGVHALQIGNVLPATSATYLPENGFLGLFPTWETTLAQLALLLIAVAAVLYNRAKDSKFKKEREMAAPKQKMAADSK